MTNIWPMRKKCLEKLFKLNWNLNSKYINFKFKCYHKSEWDYNIYYLAPSTTPSPIKSTANSIGTEFILIFPWNNGNSSKSPTVSLDLINVNSLDTTVTIQYIVEKTKGSNKTYEIEQKNFTVNANSVRKVYYCIYNWTIIVFLFVYTYLNNVIENFGEITFYNVKKNTIYAHFNKFMNLLLIYAGKKRR